MSRQSEIRERLEKASAWTPHAKDPKNHNANFISHSHCDIRYLLDRLEAAEGLLREVEDWAQQNSEQIPQGVPMNQRERPHSSTFKFYRLLVVGFGITATICDSLGHYETGAFFTGWMLGTTMAMMEARWQ